MNRHVLVPTVHLILKKGQKFLLLRRYQTGFQDGNYSVVAGHVEADETAVEAVIREAKEEVGIELDKASIEMLHVVHRKRNTRDRVDFWFTATNWNGEVTNMEPHKCDDLCWKSASDFPSNMVPYVVEALESIQGGNAYSEFGW